MKQSDFFNETATGTTLAKVGCIGAVDITVFKAALAASSLLGS